jgi:hypothetical protein
MATRERRAYEARVLGLQDDALMQYSLGRVRVAVASYRQACDLVREAVDNDGASAADVQQLASMLYTLGEWELAIDEFPAAIASLTDAQSQYEHLARLGGGPGGGDPAQLVADVVIRRARVHAAAGHDLSALVDAQRVVLTSLDLAVGRPRSPARLDAARVVALAAQVQLHIGGDPDLVVGCADWAIREFIGGLQAGDALEVRPGDLSAFRLAASIASRVHSAFGRSEPARAARWFSEAVGGDDGLGLPGVDEIRRRPTLAAVLTERGQRRQTLTAPATDVALLVPAMRSDGRIAAAIGELLAGLRRPSPGDGDVLLGLEAHALFAAAGPGGDINMRYRFGHYGRVWAQLLLSIGRSAQASRPPLATDAADWLTGVLDQLAVHAMVDPDAHTTALEAVGWLRSVRADPVALERLAAMQAALDTFQSGS